MRLATTLIALATLAFAFVPTVSASHCCVACTHEWAEILLRVPGDYMEGGFRQALGEAGGDAGGCLDATVRWACETAECDRITITCEICGTLP